MIRLLIAGMILLMGGNANAYELGCTVKSHIRVYDHEASHWTGSPRVGSDFKLVVSERKITTDFHEEGQSEVVWYFDEDAEFGYNVRDLWNISPDGLSMVAYEYGNFYYTQTTGIGVFAISARCYPK